MEAVGPPDTNVFIRQTGEAEAMERGNVNIRREKLLGGLFFLLFCFDASAVTLAAALAPRLSSFSWEAGNPLSYWWNSHDLTAVPGVLVASVILSVGVYFFVQTCLVLHDEGEAEAKAMRLETGPRQPTD